MTSALRCAAIALLLFFFLPSRAEAQISPTKISFDQKLGGRAPLDAAFRDEAGREVRLGDYFNRGKPVVLAFAYFECPMLCSMVMNGLVGSLKGMSLEAGRDYELVIVSIDPLDTPERARAKKATYTSLYGRPAAEEAFHFLTGEEPSIQALTQAAGFRYVYDPESKQFAHASGAVVLTPGGELSRYLYGIDFPPRDLRLAMVEAGQGTIGTATDRLLLLCYSYDPKRGKYSAMALTSVRAGGALTVLLIGGWLFAMSRRRRETSPGGEA
jgi:protein SCO1/2